LIRDEEEEEVGTRQHNIKRRNLKDKSKKAYRVKKFIDIDQILSDDENEKINEGNFNNQKTKVEETKNPNQTKGEDNTPEFHIQRGAYLKSKKLNREEPGQSDKDESSNSLKYGSSIIIDIVNEEETQNKKLSTRLSISEKLKASPLEKDAYNSN
jgi:hypothetical protein